MKGDWPFFTLLFFLLAGALFALEEGQTSGGNFNENPGRPLEDGTANLLDMDERLDSLFDEDSGETPTGEQEEEPSGEEENGLSLLGELTEKQGLTFTAAYAFAGGISPGWNEAPWKDEYNDSGYTRILGLDLGCRFTFDFQLSRFFRVQQAFSLNLPSGKKVLNLDSFWGAYNFRDYAYLKMGKLAVSWGMGSNYSFTNLPSRIPRGKTGGDTYSLVLDIPWGIGGFQLLTFIRTGFVPGGDIEKASKNDFAHGLKYNFAVPFVDMNMGILYHKEMLLRSFLSGKTTLWGRTELYSEVLCSVNHETFANWFFSADIGFYDDFFKNRLAVNGEYFYNGESEVNYEEEDGKLIQTEKSPFLEGHNMALNFSFKPLTSSSLRLFLQGMYNINEQSCKLMPGVNFTFLEEFNLFFTLPMVLGRRDGAYYRSNYDEKNRPFSIVLGLRLDGDCRLAWYR